jgi:hypothetical protein
MRAGLTQSMRHHHAARRGGAPLPPALSLHGAFNPMSVHPLRTLRRLLSSLLIALSLALVIAPLTSGCYERVVVQPRKAAASAKIFVEVTSSPSFVDAVTQAQYQSQVESSKVTGFTPPDEAQVRALIDQLDESLLSHLSSELPAKNIGFVTRDLAAADLKLVASLRLGGPSFVVDWQIIEPKQNVVLRGGVTTGSYAYTSDPIEPHIDQMLVSLVELDLDAYASGGPLIAPTNADNPASATPGQDAWAIVVGIEAYRDKLPAATFAENDAQEFATYLEKTLNVPPTHIKLMVGDRAARADLSSAIEEWLPRNAKAPGGRVYVFFSGHGAPDTETGDAYLVPYDADPAYLKTRGYSIAKLYDELNKLPDQQVYVFLDACFSGSGDRSVLAEGTRPLVPVKAPEAKAGVAAYAAAMPNQTTGGLKARKHGMFTAHLLDALRGAADANSDGNISLDEVAAHVNERVEQDARLQNREQTPVLTLPPGSAGQQHNLVQNIKK